MYNFILPIPFLDRLVSELEREGDGEGFRTTVYDDLTGRPVSLKDLHVADPKGGYKPAFKGSPTIGIGTNLRWGLTLPQARMAAAVHCDNLHRQLTRNTWYADLGWDNPRLVCLNMAYHMGARGFTRFASFHLLPALGARNWLGTAQGLADSYYADDYPARCARLVSLLITP